VPHVNKDGIQGIQGPLKDLYPEQGSLAGASGIDSWLSVWSNGILVENVDDHGRKVERFYPIDSLHYCDAVRYVVGSNITTISTSAAKSILQQTQQQQIVPTVNSVSDKVAKFLPLDSPISRHADARHPPLFACILRRTTGIKVLECHAFVCKREAAANALVRCCFRAYKDSIRVKQESLYLQYYGRINISRSNSNSNSSTMEKVEPWKHGKRVVFSKENTVHA